MKQGDRQKGGSKDGTSESAAAARMARITAPLSALAAPEALSVETRRALAAGQREIARRINQDPALSVLLLINPVLAFKEFGVAVSQEVSHHILHTLQFPPRLRQRHDALEQSLTQALGEAPRMGDPSWVAGVVFGKLKLKPLDSGGHQPAYASALDAAALERLQQLRPVQQPRPPRTSRIGVRSVLSVAPQTPSSRNLDLDAPLPQLAPAAEAPAALTLEQLYFYKDSHPLAHDLLEFGVILQQGFSFQTPATFRDVRDGKKPSAFRAWVKSVRFAEKRK